MGASLSKIVIHLQYPNRSSYFDDWLDAFRAKMFVPVNLLSLREVRRKRSLIEEADLIVILHSVTANNLVYLEQTLPIFEKRKGRLVVFVGNEFNAVSNGMRHKRDLIRELGAEVVATQLLKETGDWLYSDVCDEVVSVPHALNPNAFQPGLGIAKRNIKIGVRAGLYPSLLGDDERNRLLEKLKKLSASDEGIDISMDARLDRKGWSSFLQGCQSTLSTEAGSWFLDKEDLLIRRIESDFGVKRGVSTRSVFYRVGQRLPWRLKGIAKKILGANQVSVKRTNSEEEDPLSLAALQRDYFTEDARCPHYSKCVSSRHFDAIGTKTIQVLMEGRYNDILSPGKHYLPISRSLKELDEVVEQLSDATQFQEMVDEAYEYAMDAHRHDHRVDYLLASLGLS